MVGDLFIHIGDDENILFLGSTEKFGEISLRLHHPEQHRGYFHLVLEEGKGRHHPLLKDEIVVPAPASSRELTFRICRKKGRSLVMEVLQKETIVHTRKIDLPPRPLRFLAVLGFIPLLFLVSSLFFNQGTGIKQPASKVDSPPIDRVEETSRELLPEPAPSLTREVVIGDGNTKITGPETPNQPDTERPAETEGITESAKPERQGVLFLPDSPELTALAKERLNQIPLREEDKTLTLLQIRGHCALWGTEAGRQKLSVERAEAVAGYLADRGARILPETIIEGLGATEPLTRDPDNQEINRRVEILLTYR